jgi:hypothetical protein
MRLPLAGVAAALALTLAASAEATIPNSLKTACERRDAADGNKENGVDLPFLPL